jgi:2-polyprenyl-3-methyl-5-hydroxy-6-metoxy-1,4-benzoquinol methylase
MAVGHKDTNREVEPLSQAPGASEAAVPNRGATVGLTNERVSSYFANSKNYLDIRRYVIEIRAETVREFTANRKFNRILDIGCGDGSISIPLLTATNRLTLLDISSAMLSRALSRVSPEHLKNVDTLNLDFLDAPLEPGSYDLIICVGVLAHVESPELVIEKVSRLLEPGGLLMLECTDSANFSNQLTVMIGRVRGALARREGYHTRLVTAESVISMANRRGFKLLSMYRHNVALPLMGKFLSQRALQRFIRLVFGTTKWNRNAWLGKECIFAFERTRLDAPS